MNYSKFFRFWLVLLQALAIVATLEAQVNFGRISGVVSDSSGAILPNVSVRITNEATSVERVVTTNETGSYVATNLPVGLYTAKVEQQGFQAAARTGLNLVADGRLTVDFSLQLASAATSVDVIDTAGEMVNTVSGELARVVTTEQVQDLALNGRNYIQLATLIPGSALLDENQFAQFQDVNQQSINGSRNITSNLMVDGGYNIDSGSNSSQVNNVGIDFIAEVNLKTSNFSAEYGRHSGAAINVITRSGSNRFHGGAFEFLRNDRLDARNFFSPTKGKLRFNDFGWNLGGPVVRNKLFFFGGQEWKRLRQDAAPRLATLPTRQERLGNFSGRGGSLFLPGTTTPVPNRDLSSLMTTDGRAIAKVYDLMEKAATSYTDTPTANNAVYQFANPFDWRQDLIRLDYNLNPKHLLYGRYLHDVPVTVDPLAVAGLPTVPIRRVRPGHSYQLTHNWTITPSLMNEARGNATWHAQRRQTTGGTWQRETYGFTFPQVFNGGPFENSIPATTITGFTQFLGPRFIFLSPATDISFSDNLSWVKSNHAIKTGLQIIRNRKNQNGQADHAGAVTFNTAGNPRTTGNAFADALLGNFRTYNETNDDPSGFFRFTQADAYVQDNWKVTRRFSLEFGVRYQYGVPMYTQANNVSNFDPSLYDPARAVTVTAAGLLVPGSGNRFNGLIRAGDGVPESEIGRVPGAATPEARLVPSGAPRGFYEAKHLLAPRFSFAWSPRDNKTSVRGGVGLFYDRPSGNIFFPILLNPPYLSSVQFENGNLAQPAQGTAAALAPFSTVNAIDPQLDIPYALNYSFSIQRELPQGYLVEAAYVGNLGRHLLRFPDINQATFESLAANAALPANQRLSVNTLRPYKGYSAIQMRRSDSTSNYHALQLYANKRKGNIMLTGSYTWSKVLTDSSSDGENPEDPFNRHFNYGPATFDRRHVLVATYSYRLPWSKDWAAPVKFVLAGWELSGINRFQTGPYYTVTGTTSIGARRADYRGGSVFLPGDQRSAGRYFNTAAFAPAPDSRRGNSGVGNVQGPAMFLWDVSLRKEFAATERIRVRFQGDMFNLLNHTNFRGLATNASTIDFGSISAAGPARNVQFGIKVQF